MTKKLGGKSTPIVMPHAGSAAHDPEAYPPPQPAC